jgi:HSP20 family molecular chaperone IbpA
MNTEAVNTRPQQAAAEANATQSSRPEFALRPPVDVFENNDGITLWADMPGVSRDRLNLRIDGNALLLEGDVEFPIGGNMQALYADVRSNRYECSFVLSNELDTSRIEANLKDGVLTVRIPKRAELRPRRIEVQTA